MSSQAFLWVNLGIVLLVVALFLIGRNRVSAPSKLNLRKQTQKSSSSVQAARGFDSQGNPNFKAQPGNSSKEKNLNVIFMYNGHNFDAHEVLGIPAGSKWEAVQQAYEKAKLVQGSDLEFLEAAFTSIRESLGA